MRLVALVNSFIALVLYQQMVSVWFLFDFFLTRDSSSVHRLWKTQLAKREHHLDELQALVRKVQSKQCPPELLSQASFDKLILIVIDALGSKFIPTIEEGHSVPRNISSQDAMPFVEDSIRRGQAMGFVARAASPTVTMPRIKSLLSGTIPSFADIIFNLASDVSKFEDDNILRAAKAQNKSLVFYGDDTWLSLFNRSMFTRVKETFSFFASDYIKVDTNVTDEALPETQLPEIDWDFLILHYLGLDHIGHVFGSNKHSLIRAKLLEMDSVIKKIHDNMKEKNHKTLVVICGDHGMSEEGNHGGSSDLESRTALIFMPINQALQNFHPGSNSRDTLSQVDLAPTLALLLGLRLPENSKGVASEQFIKALWSKEGDSKLACAALENVMGLVNLTVGQKFKSSAEYFELTNLLNKHYKLLKPSSDIAHGYFKVSQKIQVTLLEAIASRSNPAIVALTVLLISLASILRIRKASLRLLIPLDSRREKILYIISLATPIMMLGSTDFIETEHMFWPFYALVIFLMFCANSVYSRSGAQTPETLRVILLILTFIITSTRRYFKPSVEGQVFPIMSLTILCNSIRLRSDTKGFKGLLPLLIGIMIFWCKHVEESPDLEKMDNIIWYRAMVQRLATLSITVHTVFSLIASEPKHEGSQSSSLIGKLATGWLCMSFLLARKDNFLFLISSVILEASLNSIANSLNFTPIARALVYVNFAQSSFYNQGNSNLLSSIDVKPAFYGQTNYNVFFATLFVGMATYSTQIYWFMKMFQRIHDLKTAPIRQQELGVLSKPMSYPSHYSLENVGELVVIRNFLSFAYYTAVCLVLRNHLFVWSVISPKLLYHFTTNLLLLVVTLVVTNVNEIKFLEKPNSLKRQQA